VRLADWLSIRLKAWTATGPSGPFGGHATLTDGLVSYWTLDEASGTRADSVGTNHLTDNNTVTSVAGVFNDAASFVAANSEYLSHVDDGAALSIDGDKTFAAWVYRTTAGANMAIVSQRTSGNGAYQLYFDTADKLHAYITDSVAGFSEPSITTSVVAGTWNFCVMWYDSSDKKLRVQMNGGTIAAGSALSNGPVASTQDFNVVRLAGSIYGNGAVDELGIWSRVLTTDERTDLYNGGAGLFYGS